MATDPTVTINLRVSYSNVRMTVRMLANRAALARHWLPKHPIGSHDYTNCLNTYLDYRDAAKLVAQMLLGKQG